MFNGMRKTNIPTSNTEHRSGKAERVPRVFALVALCLACGCSRESGDSSPATTEPASTQPTTRPEPRACVLTIGGQRYAFPPAHLRVTKSDAAAGHLAALYTDEPKDDDAPNHLLLEMPLEHLDDPAGVVTADYRIQIPPGTEREESPQGIVLTGKSPRQLLPQDVTVRFAPGPAPGLVTATIDGKFATVGAAPNAKDATVTVTATIDAVLE
jgi:hypothetical protein